MSEPALKDGEEQSARQTRLLGDKLNRVGWARGKMGSALLFLQFCHFVWVS